ncbi:MAG: hypothetical protein ACI8X5_003706 [Planctomycetota bacterium]
MNVMNHESGNGRFAKVVVVLIAIGLLLGFWSLLGQDESSAMDYESIGPGGLIASAAPDAEVLTTLSKVPETREGVDGPEDLTEEPEDEMLFELLISVRDDLDLPVRGADVYLAPVRQPMNFVGSTGMDGSFLASFHGREPSMEVALFVESPDLERDRAFGRTLGEDFNLRGGVLSGLRMLELVAGERIQVALAPRENYATVVGLLDGAGEDLEADMAGTIAGMIKQSNGKQLERFKGTLKSLEELGYVDGKEAKRLMKIVVRREKTVNWESGEDVTRNPEAAGIGSHVPDVAFTGRVDEESGLLTFTAPFGSRGGKPIDRRRKSAIRLDRDGSEEEDAPQENSPTDTKLLITITKANGSPAAGAAITLDRGKGWRVPIFADAQGEYIFDDLKHGEVRIRAGGGDLGLSEETLNIIELAKNTWDATLARGKEFRAMVVDENGMPLAKWQAEMEFTGDGNAHADTAITDSDGIFTIPNLPSGSFRLLLRPEGPWGNPPALVREGFLADGILQTVRVPTELRSSMSARLQILHAGGEKLNDILVRVWNPAIGRGSWMIAKAEFTRKFMDTLDLAAGVYEYEVGGMQCGWSQRRGFPSGTLGKVVFGEVSLPEPGSLLVQRLVSDDARSLKDLRLFNTTSSVDVLVCDGMEGIDFPVSLPNGKYRIERSGGESTDFVLEPGKTFTIEA